MRSAGSDRGAVRVELDASVRRTDGGRLLVGGTPPRLVRLSVAGARALDSILAGGREDAGSQLARELEARGLLHPLPGEGSGEPEVTTIVPSLDGGEALVALVRALVDEGPVIVVDDGSRDDSGDRAAAAGARVIRHPFPRGPAAARNAGLRAAGTGLVAFLDADCSVVPGWRRGLAAMLRADPDLALLAPRVRSAPGSSALARYERLCSPLDLGPDGGLVGPGRRVAYLPAAALVGRRDALLALGGFDESMRLGEDVDLVWRLLAAGRGVRYVPARQVVHAPRPTLAAMMRQRAGYGASAPDLARRHGGAVAPLRAGAHTYAVWAGALSGKRAPLLVPLALAGSTALVAGRGSERASRLALASLALRGNALATRHLARALVREWLPLSLCAAARDRRARRVLLAAAALDLLAAIREADGPAGAVPSPGLRALDHAAYSAGLWRAAIARREPAALLPRLGSGPRSGRAFG